NGAPHQVQVQVVGVRGQDSHHVVDVLGTAGEQLHDDDVLGACDRNVGAVHVDHLGSREEQLLDAGTGQDDVCGDAAQRMTTGKTRVRATNSGSGTRRVKPASRRAPTRTSVGAPSRWAVTSTSAVSRAAPWRMAACAPNRYQRRARSNAPASAAR